MYPPITDSFATVQVTARFKSHKPLLRLGSKGSEVVELRKLLTNWNIPIDKPGDFFNPQLEKAVKTFQRRMFLEENGVVDGLTWKALYTGAPINMPPLHRGSSGRAVKLLQEVLQAERDYEGSVDGVFGGQTERAVRQFQKRRGLIVDGVVGNCTWHALSKIPR